MTAQERSSAPAGDAGIDRFLRWGLVVTLVVVVSVLIYGTVVVHRDRPPIPDRVVDPNGAVLYTKDDIIDGKGVFQRTDLMDFGSLYGNGAYFGPDWGTDYLHREGQLMRGYYAKQRFGSSYDSLGAANRSAIDQQVVEELKTNRYSDGVLTLTDGQAAAHGELQAYYRSLFIDGDKKLGLPADTVHNSSGPPLGPEEGSHIQLVDWLQRVVAAHGYFEQVRSTHSLVHHGAERYLASLARFQSRRTYDRLEGSAPFQHLHIDAFDAKSVVAYVGELESVGGGGVQGHLAKVRRRNREVDSWPACTRRHSVASAIGLAHGRQGGLRLPGPASNDGEGDDQGNNPY
jgi:hypothetical protein